MPVMDNGVLILSLSSIVVLEIKNRRSCQEGFNLSKLFLQTVLNYQDFMYPNISPCPSLLPLKTAATFASSFELSPLTRRGNRSKDPDRRVWSGQNLQTY